MRAHIEYSQNIKYQRIMYIYETRKKIERESYKIYRLLEWNLYLFVLKCVCVCAYENKIESAMYEKKEVTVVVEFGCAYNIFVLFWKFN